MIPLYISGLLQRFGPQHGYQIRKTIGEQFSDFTQIKLPTIYYHLEKMEANGQLSAKREKPDGRPEKTVYDLTAQGRESFQKRLEEILAFDYRPTFSADGVFYFSEFLETERIIKSLEDYIVRLEHSINALEKHKEETMLMIPAAMRKSAVIVFRHHESHYRAEHAWAVQSLADLREK